MYNYNCPDCEETKIQCDKNTRKINEVIKQVNALIDANNETDDFIEEKVEEKVEEIAEIKVNEVLGDLRTEIDNLESEVNDLKEGNINIDLTNYATKDYVEDAINNAKLEGGEVQVDLSSYAKKTDLHEHSNKSVLDKITSSKVNQWDSKSNFDGNYNNLTNKPTSLPANGGNASTVGGYSLWVGTQTQYNAIASKSDTTVYIIKGE